MSINLEKKLSDEQGKPIILQATKEQASVRELVLVALALPMDEDKKERYALIKKLEAKEELIAADLGTVAKWVDKAFPSPVVWGRIMDELAN